MMFRAAAIRRKEAGTQRNDAERNDAAHGGITQGRRDAETEHEEGAEGRTNHKGYGEEDMEGKQSGEEGKKLHVQILFCCFGHNIQVQNFTRV